MNLMTHNPAPMLWGMPAWVVPLRPRVMPLGWVPAPKVVEVEHQDTLRIRASFTYVGPEFRGYFHGAIGARVGWMFDEIVVTREPFSLGEHQEPTRLGFFVDIPITTALAAGHYYSIYVKIVDEAGNDMAFSPFYENAIFVVRVEPEITDLVIEDYYVV